MQTTHLTVKTRVDFIMKSSKQMQSFAKKHLQDKTVVIPDIFEIFEHFQTLRGVMEKEGAATASC